METSFLGLQVERPPYGHDDTRKSSNHRTFSPRMLKGLVLAVVVSEDIALGSSALCRFHDNPSEQTETVPRNHKEA